jgi:hypothetical protein
MKHGIYDWYKELPSWGKGVVIVGGLGVVVYVGLKISKSITAKAAAAKANIEVTGFVSDLNNLQSQGINPSYQESQYKQWADSIQTQFTGCDPSLDCNSSLNFSCLSNCSGSDWVKDDSCYSDSGKIVYGILKQLNNDADFLALQTAWGIRSYTKHTWCGGDVPNVTLSAASADQLSTDEIGGLNLLLKSKSIKYTF